MDPQGRADDQGEAVNNELVFGQRRRNMEEGWGQIDEILDSV
jgi:hypothetical protein